MMPWECSLLVVSMESTETLVDSIAEQPEDDPRRPDVQSVIYRRVYNVHGKVTAQQYMSSGEGEQIVDAPCRIACTSEYVKMYGAPPPEPDANTHWLPSDWHEDNYSDVESNVPDALVAKALSLVGNDGWEVCGQETTFGLRDKKRWEPLSATWLTRTYTLKRHREDAFHE